jgi:hypothetical protein
MRFLNLHTIQRPQGIIIDQINNIVDTILGPYLKSRDVTQMLPIMNPFPTDSHFEQDLYDSPIFAGSKLQALKKKYGGYLFH